ncbi:MAG TPA: PAS domain S-box protein, partial [Chloroflexota bacterium]|nr:PAS domain S-box protein [Chloroflexota bacterium]
MCELIKRDTATPILSDARVTGAVDPFDGSERTESAEARRLLAAIIASSDDAIMTKDMDDRITTWNPSAERLYGYTAAEMIGQPSLRLVPPERADEMFRILERVQRGERVDHFETVRLRKDGSRVDVSVSVAPLVDAAGRLVGASAIARDITERKRAEQELAARARQQAALATLRQLALASDNLSTLMDEAVALVARTLDVEHGAMLELLPDHATLLLRAGVGWSDGLVGRATVGLDSQAGHALASSEPVIVADLRTETRFRGRSLLHEHGVVSGVSVIMGGRERPVGALEVHTTRPRRFTTDEVHFLRAAANLLATVSARTGAEEALRASERRYRALFEQSPMGLILYAPDGRLLDANRAVLGTLPRERTAGYNVLSDPRFVAAGVMDDIRRAFAGEAVELPPLPVDPPPGSAPREGQARWVRASLYPVMDDAGAVREVVAMTEDITEQMQAYQLLEQRVAGRT